MKKAVFYTGLFLSSFQLHAQNVGIGTTNPISARLEVVESNATNRNIFVARKTATGTGISVFADGKFPTVGFNGANASGDYYRFSGGYSAFMSLDTLTGKFGYYTTTAAGTPGGLIGNINEIFTMLPSGNIGINNNAPAQGLHIKGKSLLVENSSGFSDISLTATTSAVGGLIELQNNTGIRTVALRAGDGAGISGELIFYNNTGSTSTLELDGDFGNTGRSRIIVDELQIKGGADFAEYFDVAATATTKPEPGLLVSIDEKNMGKLVVSHVAYDKKVAGIISGANGIKPGMMMGHKGTIANGEYPVAITGRVYVKAEALSSFIRPGDLLTTSAMAGHAMKAANGKKSQGAIIGKAMSNLEKGTTGMVLVLLGIQ